MSIVNAIKNPSFDNGLDYWKQSANGTITHQTSGGYANGSCVILSPSSSSLNIVQFVPLKHGQYTVQAKVKKVNGTPDAWIQVQCNGTTVNSPSVRNQLTENGFTDITVSFSNSSSTWKYAAVFLICSGGDVILDEVELNTNDYKIIQLLKYGTVNAIYVQIRNAPNQSAAVIAHAPKNRKMVLRETDDYAWLECRCKLAHAPYVGSGYIKREYINDITNADDPDNDYYEYPYNRISKVGRAEESIIKGSEHSIQEYYSPNLQTGKWCHYFAEWLSTICYWGSLSDSQSSIPFTGNCGTGILWFLQHGAFKFTNAIQKSKIRALSDFSDFISSNELTSSEVSYEPEAGDFIYFASDKIDEASSHVAVVIDIDGDSIITIAEGNNGSDTHACINSISPSDERFSRIVGFGKPLNRGVG